jgi:hypothetical protein
VNIRASDNPSVDYILIDPERSLFNEKFRENKERIEPYFEQIRETLYHDESNILQNVELLTFLVKKLH